MPHETPTIQIELDPKNKAWIDLAFKHGEKLYKDVFSPWTLVNYAIKSDTALAILIPMQHYEAYLQSQDQATPGLFQYVMSKSEPEVVEKYNQLVDELNADLERIKSDKDTVTLLDYYQKVKELFN